MRGIFVAILTLGWMLPLRAETIAEYAAEADPRDPAATGWREVKGVEAVIAGPEPAGSPNGPAWRIGGEGSHVNRLAYRWMLPLISFQAKGWKVEATLRVAAASAEKAQDAFLEVQDGISEWSIVFAKDAKVEGAGFLDRDNQWQSLYNGDVSSKPFTIEAAYQPASDSLKVSINGSAVEREITREDVPLTRVGGRYFLTWGDGASASRPGKIRSEVFWQSVKFETKQ